MVLNVPKRTRVQSSWQESFNRGNRIESSLKNQLLMSAWRKRVKMSNDVEIGQQCKELRERLGLSMANLAIRAGVSNRSVATVEGEKLYHLVKKSATTLRRKKAWARVLARLALALGLSPDTWLAQFQEATGFAFSKEELQTLKEHDQVNPNVRTHSEPSMTDTWEGIQAGLKSKPNEPYPIPVAYLYSGGFTPDKRSKGPDKQGTEGFFERFVRRLFAVLNPQLEPADSQEFVPSVENLLEDMLEKKKYRLAMGLFPMTARDKLHFLPIPGWTIQLACLARAGGDFEWQDVLQGPEPKDLRALTVKNDAWDCFLRGAWGEKCNRIVQLPKYDVVEIAEKLKAQFEEEEAAAGTMSQSVFVTDQATAAEVRRVLLHKSYRNVKDLAEGGGAEVPRFQLSMAVREDDRKWAERLEKALHSEMFGVYGYYTAGIYADYMLSVLSSEPGRYLSKEFEQNKPSYLCLDDFGGDNSAKTFPGVGFCLALKRRVTDGIRERLKKHSAKLGDRQTDLEQLTNSLLGPACLKVLRGNK